MRGRWWLLVLEGALTGRVHLSLKMTEEELKALLIILDRLPRAVDLYVPRDGTEEL